MYRAGARAGKCPQYRRSLEEKAEKCLERSAGFPALFASRGFEALKQRAVTGESAPSSSGRRDRQQDRRDIPSWDSGRSPGRSGAPRRGWPRPADPDRPWKTGHRGRPRARASARLSAGDLRCTSGPPRSRARRRPHRETPRHRQPDQDAIPALRTFGVAKAPLVQREEAQPRRQQRHHPAEREPRVGPPVKEHHRVATGRAHLREMKPGARGESSCRESHDYVSIE